VSDLSLPLSRLLSHLLHFLSPVQLWRGSDRALLVVTWHPARISPPHPWKLKVICKFLTKKGQSGEAILPAG